MHIEVSSDPDFGVTADVVLTIDATNAEDVNESLESFEASYEDDWVISSESIIQ